MRQFSVTTFLGQALQGHICQVSPRPLTNGTCSPGSRSSPTLPGSLPHWWEFRGKKPSPSPLDISKTLPIQVYPGLPLDQLCPAVHPTLSLTSSLYLLPWHPEATVATGVTHELEVLLLTGLNCHNTPIPVQCTLACFGKAKNQKKK
jgi:hypothetical protein